MEDTTPVLANSTAGVELAGEAEKAIAAKPEALEPGAYRVTRQGAGAKSRCRSKRMSEGPSWASEKSHAQAKTSPSSMWARTCGRGVRLMLLCCAIGRFLRG